MAVELALRILKLLHAGRGRPEIAAMLGITEGEVEEQLRDPGRTDPAPDFGLGPPDAGAALEYRRFAISQLGVVRAAGVSANVDFTAGAVFATDGEGPWDVGAADNTTPYEVIINPAFPDRLPLPGPGVYEGVLEMTAVPVVGGQAAWGRVNVVITDFLEASGGSVGGLLGPRPQGSARPIAFGPVRVTGPGAHVKVAIDNTPWGDDGPTGATSYQGDLVIKRLKALPEPDMGI